MRYYFSLISTLTFLIFVGSCNNAGNTTATVSDTLSTDSTAATVRDHTSVAKDSGTIATAMPVDSLDKSFIIKAISDGTLEMNLGDLAQQNGASASVKRFGDMMLKDHTGINATLRNIARQLQVAVPDSMTAKHSLLQMEMRQQKKGTAFDKTYMKMILAQHKENIADFQQAATSNNTVIKNFATSVLPVIEKHLDSAKVIYNGF